MEWMGQWPRFTGRLRKNIVFDVYCVGVVAKHGDLESEISSREITTGLAWSSRGTRDIMLSVLEYEIIYNATLLMPINLMPAVSLICTATGKLTHFSLSC